MPTFDQFRRELMPRLIEKDALCVLVAFHVFPDAITPPTPNSTTTWNVAVGRSFSKSLILGDQRTNWWIHGELVSLNYNTQYAHLIYVFSNFMCLIYSTYIYIYICVNIICNVHKWYIHCYILCKVPDFLSILKSINYHETIIHAVCRHIIL